MPQACHQMHEPDQNDPDLVESACQLPDGFDSVVR
jgi:hypothetical protein